MQIVVMRRLVEVMLAHTEPGSLWYQEPMTGPGPHDLSAGKRMMSTALLMLCLSLFTYLACSVSLHASAWGARSTRREGEAKRNASLLQSFLNVEANVQKQVEEAGER